MKTLTHLAIVLLSVTTLTAQLPEKQNSRKAKLSIEQQATLKAKQLTLKLYLSDSQETAVKAIIKKNLEDRKNYSKRKNKEEITPDMRYNMQLERLNNQIKMQRDMQAILNKEQFEIWKDMKSEKAFGNNKRKRIRTKHKH